MENVLRDVANEYLYCLEFKRGWSGERERKNKRRRARWVNVVNVTTFDADYEFQIGEQIIISCFSAGASACRCRREKESTRDKYKIQLESSLIIHVLLLILLLFISYFIVRRLDLCRSRTAQWGNEYSHSFLWKQ